jgi:hypothetical protein
MDTPKSSPKDVFLHLMVFVTLYASVVSLITLLFQYINFWYPDPLNFYYESVLSSIRWSASVLLVMYAVFVFVSWLINKDFAAEPEKKNIKIRKWLVYLTLFLSALTMIIDVITLLYNYLGGEFTASFFLKILAVLMVAAAVFGYYFWDLQKDAGRKQLKLFAWVVSLTILVALIGSFFVVGSPATQRSRKFDSTRISDLQNIQYEIVNFWNEKNALPNKLSDLTSSISGFVPPTDPGTKQAYEYQVKSNLVFALCANFELPSLNQTENLNATRPMSAPYNQNWTHAAGQVCFERIIDPQRDKTLQAIPVK